MNELEQGFLATLTAGVYRWLSPAEPRDLARAAQAQRWRFFYLDGRRARNKASFLQTVADAMMFPAYFGHNWDAFEECLNDLEWAPAPGYVLLYDHVWWFACEHAERWQVAHSILEKACERWASQGVPFVVLLRHTHGCSGVTELLSAPCSHHLPLRVGLR